MLKESPKHVRETVELTLQFYANSKEVTTPDKFVKALYQNKEAKTIFENLPPPKKLEIVKY